MVAKYAIPDFCPADRILTAGHVSSPQAASDVGSCSSSNAFN
jgi:hypothetical protein